MMITKHIFELTTPLISAILRTRPYIITNADGVVIFCNDLAVNILNGTPSYFGEISRITCDGDKIVLPVAVDGLVREVICAVRIVEESGYVVMLYEKQRQVNTDSEVIHQIRNGIAIMHALLEIEISTAPENEINRLIISQARIKALTAVYDSTSDDPNDDVNILNLITTIIRNTQSAFMIKQQVEAAESSEIKLTAKQALHFSMVIVEIAIHIAKNSDEVITISCPDTNTIRISIPAKLPELPEMSKSIIEGYLVKQLGGRYKVEYGDEFSVELTIGD